MNFRNSDYMTAPVDYVESVDSAVCGKHAVSYFGSSFLSELRVLVCIDLHLCWQESILHGHFVPPPEVASLSQQGRIAAAQRACEVFRIV